MRLAKTRGMTVRILRRPGLAHDLDTPDEYRRYAKEQWRVGGAGVKVLITGGMGVIGAETSRKFVKEGHRPVIFARHRDDSLIADIIDKVDFEQGDVLDMPRILADDQEAQGDPCGACRGLRRRRVGGQSCAQHPGQRDGPRQRARSRPRARRTARRLHQRQGRLWPRHRRIRLIDLEADERRSAGEAQAHLRFGEVHGRERLRLLQRQHGHRDGVAALCLDLRPRQDRAARPDGGDEPHRRKSGRMACRSSSNRAATTRTTSSTTRTSRSGFISRSSPTNSKAASSISAPARA